MFLSDYFHTKPSRISHEFDTGTLCRSYRIGMLANSCFIVSKAEILENLFLKNTGPFENEMIENIYKMIFGESKKLQK